MLVCKKGGTESHCQQLCLASEMNNTQVQNFVLCPTFFVVTVTDYCNHHSVDVEKITHSCFSKQLMGKLHPPLQSAGYLLKHVSLKLTLCPCCSFKWVEQSTPTLGIFRWAAITTQRICSFSRVLSEWKPCWSNTSMNPGRESIFNSDHPNLGCQGSIIHRRPRSTSGAWPEVERKKWRHMEHMEFKSWVLWG